MLRPFNAYFFHANPRHHSIAFIETGRNAIHHLMVELFSLDDVGQCYDLALGEQDRIGVTLGRHINDEVTSFYSELAVGLHGRVRLGRPRHRRRQLADRRGHLRARACGATTGCG